jgi:hypothetical protein
VRRDVFVYLSGPITPKNGRTAERNAADALAVHLRLVKDGIPSFCPHLCGMFPSAWTDVSYDQWMAYDLAVLDRCTHVLMLDGWRESAGADLEVRYAVDRGMPIAFSEDELYQLLGVPV